MKRATGIGSAIRRYREARGLTQTEFGEVLRRIFGQQRAIDHAMVSQWESERAMLANDKLLLIERLIGVPEGTFIVAKWLAFLDNEGLELPDVRRTLHPFLSRLRPEVRRGKPRPGRPPKAIASSSA